MPSEDDLREFFATTEAPGRPDADRAISRIRARRRPRRIAAAAAGALALVGVTIVGVQVSQVQFVQLTQPISEMSSAEDAGAPAADGIESAIKRAPAEKINLCGAPLAEVAPSVSGLQLDLVFPEEVPTGGESVQGTVRLTNLGTQQVVGTTAASPAITLSQAGTVLWHSNGPMIMSAVLVDLGPGESMEYAASFTPVRCEVEDDLAQSFRTDLPALAAGGYELSAAIDFSPSSGAALDLVTGPRSTIRLG